MPRIYCIVAVALFFAGCASPATGPFVGFGNTQSAPHIRAHHDAKSSKDLYIGNILGGVLLFSTGSDPQKVGDITDDLPRETGVWVDQKGVLYAFTDNRSAPYETIEEFQRGQTQPFFSLVLKRYGSFVAADAEQNVYAQGENSSGDQIIDVYPKGSQNYADEYVVPSVGLESAPESMAFDSSGNLLVGVAAFAQNRQGQIGAVLRLDAGSSTFVNLNLEKAYGGLIATDGMGNLYVGGAERISVYAPGATSPSRIIRTTDTIVTLTSAADGTLYVGTSHDNIIVYQPGKRKSNESFASGAQVSGIALGPG